MRVLAHLHKYPPEHGAGAEWYAHEVLLHLQARGHEVEVRARDHAKPYVFDGIRVEPARRNPILERSYAWADVVVTHLDVTRQCVMLARKWKKPVVHLIHNDRQLKYHRVSVRDAALVVCNSNWIKRELRWRGPITVARPLTPVARYRTSRESADSVTLVNLSTEKGVDVLNWLASTVPGKYVGVEGAYAVQEKTHENVRRLENTGDMTKVYAATRVLIAPSGYESWGRVAMEAACSGIPTIAHPTPGLLESLGHAGLFADRAQPAEWAKLLEMLQDDAVYNAWSKAATARAESTEKLARLELDEVAEIMEDF